MIIFSIIMKSMKTSHLPDTEKLSLKLCISTPGKSNIILNHMVSFAIEKYMITIIIHALQNATANVKLYY